MSMLIDSLARIKNTLLGTPATASDQAQLTVSLAAIAENLQATSDHPGVVELATSTETQAGSDAVRAVTPAGLAARTATTTRTGVVELATDTEAKALADTGRAVTPGNLGAVLAALGDVTFQASKGPLLISPDASVWRLKVADDGTVSAEEVTP